MKKISFMPLDENVRLGVCPPQPARKELPSWYREAGAFHTKKPLISENGDSNATYKMCAPFSDALSAGYIQKTWADISVDFNPETGEVTYKYPSIVEQMNHRERTEGKTVIPITGFYDVEFTWYQPWLPIVPKGYSVLFTHPINRLDLPFFTTEGILDTDTGFISSSPNRMPFYIKEGWTGVIPAGTPMYQIIPIKREVWKSDLIKFDAEAQRKATHKVRSHFWGSYRRYWWQKKQWD
jgi:hypothetical protein